MSGREILAPSTRSPESGTATGLVEREKRSGDKKTVDKPMAMISAKAISRPVAHRESLTVTDVTDLIRLPVLGVRRRTLETFEFPINGVAGFRLVVFRPDGGLLAIDVEGPELMIAGLSPVDSVDKPLGGDVNGVVLLEQF